MTSPDIASYLYRMLSYTRVVSSIQSKGFESLKMLFHTSNNDNDDFSELGLPMERGACVIPKLMTEKPELFLVSIIIDIHFI